MRFAALSVLAACSFQARALPSGQSDAPAGSTDGPPGPADGRIGDAGAFDAPPDACGNPTPPASTVDMTGNNGATDISLTSIQANGGQMIMVAPGASIALSFHYAITDTACSQACRDQIEVGWAPGTRVGCVFDAVVSENTGAQGDASKTLTAPTATGAYDIRANIGQNNSCGTTTTWWAGAPTDARTLARVCVH